MPRIPCNNGWTFLPADDPDFLRGIGDGQPVRLPHTFVETPYNYFDESLYQMVGIYRRTLTVPAAWADKRLLLTVGAAAHFAQVFLDGQLLGEHRCGYTAFTVELTGHVTPGQSHVLAIRVDSRETLDQPPFGYVIDYMTYGGLYREVWLDVKADAYIEDVFARPAVSHLGGAPGGTVTSDVTVNGSVAGLTLRQTLLWDSDTVAEGTFPANGRALTLSAPGVERWTLESPCLYTLRTELLRDQTVLDTHTVSIGFRTAQFRPDGFYLNGEKVKLRGLNRHQSYPYVGYAMPKAMQYLDADILKNELGCNAVRTSHYPQSPHFIDRCDQLGLLVFTEIPGWQHIGAEQWQDQAVQNTADMVRQYRNHPSIILWGVRINESVDCDNLYTRTNAVAHALDPTRPTGGVRCHKKGHFLEDVYTFNDFSYDGTGPGCAKKAAITPDTERPYLISEYNGHMFPTKSYDSELHRTAHALRHAAVLDAVAGEEDIAGAFGWCLCDYNTHRDFGSGDRVCYHGLMDMYRNPKMAAAVYAAQQSRVPVLEVTSSMDIGERPTGNPGQVYLISNAQEVRVSKNGVLLKTYFPGRSPYRHLPHGPVLIDDYVGDALEREEGFAPRQASLVKDMLNYSAVHGSARLPLALKAKAAQAMALYHMTAEEAYRLYGKYIGSWGGSATAYRFEAMVDGQVVKTVVKSPATALHLRVQADHTHLREGDTYDVSSLRLAVCDQNGNALAFYQGSAAVTLTGPVALIGPATVQLRGGCGGTYVKTTGQPGPATVTVAAEAMAPVTVHFTVDMDEKEENP